MIKKKNKFFKRLIRNLFVILIISEIGIIYSVLKYDSFSYLIENFIKINLNFLEYMISAFLILSLYDYLIYKRNILYRKGERWNLYLPSK